MRLENKVIIVTGSTTGIGKAIAKRCVQEGARVVLHGLEKDWGEEVLGELGKDSAFLHIEDLSGADAPQHLVSETLRAFGRIHPLFNNPAWDVSSNIQPPDTAFLRSVRQTNPALPF